MPFHVAQDGLEEERLSKTGAQFGSTKRGIAYTYGDKYMKKTLRMGDLCHMDEGVKKRLSTIVESKNLTMVNIYGQKPVSVDEMWAWCEHYAKVFAPYICDVGQYLAEADEAGKKIMFEAQLGALRDIDFGIYPTRLPPTPSVPTRHRRRNPGPQAQPFHRHHEGLLLLRGRGPLHHRAGHDRGGEGRPA